MVVVVAALVVVCSFLSSAFCYDVRPCLVIIQHKKDSSISRFVSL